MKPAGKIKTSTKSQDLSHNHKRHTTAVVGKAVKGPAHGQASGNRKTESSKKCVKVMKEGAPSRRPLMRRSLRANKVEQTQCHQREHQSGHQQSSLSKNSEDKTSHCVQGDCEMNIINSECPFSPKPQASIVCPLPSPSSTGAPSPHPHSINPHLSSHPPPLGPVGTPHPAPIHYPPHPHSSPPPVFTTQYHMVGGASLASCDPPRRSHRPYTAVESSQSLLTQPHDPDSLCQYYSSVNPTTCLPQDKSPHSITSGTRVPSTAPPTSGCVVDTAGLPTALGRDSHVGQLLLCVVEQFETVLQNVNDTSSLPGEFELRGYCVCVCVCVSLTIPGVVLTHSVLDSILEQLHSLVEWLASQGSTPVHPHLHYMYSAADWLSLVHTLETSNTSLKQFSH